MYKLRQIIKHYSRLTALVGINVAVWLMLRILLLCSPASAAALLHWSELPCGWMEMLHSPWSLFTYMWVQTSGLHLIFNMVCLWWVGIMLPQGRGWSVDRLYVCGGLCGGLLYAAVGAVAGNVLIGSSAAVTAVAVAVTMIAPKKKIMFPMIGTVNLMWLTGALLAVDVLSVTAGEMSGHVAHLGGALFGVAAGWHMRKWRFAPIKYEAPKREGSMMTTERIIEKIRRSGHSSLTAEERRMLFKVSRDK